MANAAVRRIVRTERRMAHTYGNFLEGLAWQEFEDHFREVCEGMTRRDFDEFILGMGGSKELADCWAFILEDRDEPREQVG